MLFLLLSLPCVAQIPPGYYNSASGLQGTALRSALHTIIDGHNQQTYPLWTHFIATDAKGNTKVWDIYSDKPGQTPPYEYSLVANQCGNYLAEGDCYNHEHTWPSSYFNDEFPARSDLFHIYPTDGWVNNKRSNYAYGVVSNPTYTSQNGSKLGPNTYPGYSGTVFEPLDSFKGDLARSYFYMATRYYTEDGTWNDWAMSNKTELKQWAINMLLEWHTNDPVSQKELDRNEAVYTIQDNRNPFIDHPEYAYCIWGICNTSVAEVLTTQPQVILYPNPASSSVHIRSTAAATMDVYNMHGQIMWHGDTPPAEDMQLNIEQWPAGIYFLRAVSHAGQSTHRFSVN